MILDYLTGALVIITAFYAWATFKILRANEKVVEVMHEQAEAMTRPYVCVSPILEPDNPIFYLRITNSGKTAAQKLRLTIDKSFYTFGEKSEDNDLASHTAFNEIISSFQPGAVIVFSLAQSFKIFSKEANNGLLPHSFTVTAEYSYLDKTVKENNIIDLAPYLGSNIPQDPYVRKLKDIDKSIEKIAINIEKKS